METQAVDWNACLQRIAAQRDRAAFKALFLHFAPLLKGFLMKSSSVSPELAEELVQETFVRVWRKSGSFNAAKANANTWIYTIARNVRIDYFRRSQRIEEQQQAFALEADEIYGVSDGAGGESELVKTRNAANIKQALTLISAEQLLVVKKIYYEGKTHSEIAHELGLPLGTVKSRVRLALKRMGLHFKNNEIVFEDQNFDSGDS